MVAIQECGCSAYTVFSKHSALHGTCNMLNNDAQLPVQKQAHSMQGVQRQASPPPSSQHENRQHTQQRLSVSLVVGSSKTAVIRVASPQAEQSPQQAITFGCMGAQIDQQPHTQLWTRRAKQKGQNPLHSSAHTAGRQSTQHAATQRKPPANRQNLRSS